jgi:hypothetical protein
LKVKWSIRPKKYVEDEELSLTPLIIDKSTIKRDVPAKIMIPY